MTTTTATVVAADLKAGDLIYGTDTVTKVYRHHRHTWRVVAETTGGEYSFPETTRVPADTDHAATCGHTVTDRLDLHWSDQLEDEVCPDCCEDCNP